ncbi:unnamed protein product [Pseudo-nitzschia multistriata]|uniref:DUF6824 domain-containing protein n=1 Tax=Pseudo-nitzschia multistriata TaxID=183589 RepID=A0A448ZPY0_9STRA|nr:unnamed protein product [Pseudo-nitzschia multistriata]
MTDNVAELAEATKKMSPDRSGSASENGDETTSTKDTTDTDSDYVVETATSSDETKSGDNDDGDDVKSEAEDDTRTQEEKDEEAKEKEEKEKQRIKELEIKYKDWPLHDIKEPHDHDVMYGRGGGTNHHPGNKRYRKMVEDRKVKYVNSKRLDKPLVALEIIKEWRAQWPPGRFLKQDEATGLWNDVGEKKAREKTSQALREKAPQIRKQQEEEKNEVRRNRI